MKRFDQILILVAILVVGALLGRHLPDIVRYLAGAYILLIALHSRLKPHEARIVGPWRAVLEISAYVLDPVLNALGRLLPRWDLAPGLKLDPSGLVLTLIMLIIIII